MYKTIAVADLEPRIRAVFDEVVHDRMPYVLAADGQPQAALIPYKDFVRFQAMREGDALNRFDHLMRRLSLQNAAYSGAEIATDVALAQEEATS